MTGASAVHTASAHGPRIGQLLPLFTLRNSCERQVRLWDFKQRRPVVLVFIHSAHCAECLQFLRTLAARREDLAEFRAAVLVISPDETVCLQRVRAELGVPFSFLSDRDGAVAARYLTRGTPDGAATGLFVADRYGECGLAATAAEASHLPGMVPILAELAHAAEGECSCLVPASPEAPHI